ncbi:MAG TPA: polymer-forming cytoskeletal protein [Hyphomicrobium sp.]|nr:polymer-forming cytoskeletal protein [Hyphomicrobium sp.]
MTAQANFGHPPAAMHIPRTATIEGFLDFDGELVVEGTVIGNVRCLSLTVKERGQVDGNVVAERVTVLGDVTGAINANDLVLRTACSVAGDIFHKQLRLEDGCYFEGKSRRHANPMSLAF